jgi:hypothetical protein
VSRALATVPQTTQTPYFTVSGGKVLITDIYGEVTTAIQNQACNMSLVSNPTVGADVAMCAVLNVANAAVGTMYNITGTFTDAMVATVSGAFKGQSAATVVSAGSIDLLTSASNTGATKWVLMYVPIDPGASVVAA